MTAATALHPLHEGDVQFRRLLEKLPAAAYTCDAQGLITYYNRRAVDLWGRAPALNSAVDRYCGSFKLFASDGTPIAHDCCWMALALRDGKEYNGREIVVERPDGSRLTALAHANPFHDGDGRVFGAVNVLVDITDRKRVEEALHLADRNKNDFLAMLAHELRNPLAPIRNGLQIMRMAGVHGTVAADACAMMERQLGHMVRLIDDLLDVSRITKGKVNLQKERVDIATVVQDAVETSRQLIEASGHSLRVSLPDKPVHVHADRTRLAQVFANLLNNSAKYTPAGGRIEMSVRRQGTDVMVSVKDNGTGIQRELLPSIFDAFMQADRSLERSQGGLGIGLSLVKGLVQMHGGSVEARSDGPGTGSEFVVRLSDVIAPEEGDPTGLAPVDSGETAYRILIVDDNVDAAVSLSMMLKLMGHETLTVHDGEAAVEAASSFRPHVVLLDIGLPKLNGYDACRRMRAIAGGEHVVLIALTGWGQDEDKRHSKDAGFNFHMIKPVDPQALHRLLGGLLVSPV
ncbi:ATP-binding protein [Piscinibacter sp. XHJ-5]|uniref:hybrid sensor histidine kinase/response regulator n=1 Tax=Piscinibacter sp. XHJ-5 TaxID=3037797 RepID=UPI0024528BBA|nr:ATP-binding protein [Piscinibacter sp. XHJ-5]